MIDPIDPIKYLDDQGAYLENFSIQQEAMRRTEEVCLDHAHARIFIDSTLANLRSSYLILTNNSLERIASLAGDGDTSSFQGSHRPNQRFMDQWRSHYS